MEGKIKCRVLSGLRQRIADLNNIDYKPHVCYNTEDCVGTCPACDKEEEWLYLQLKIKEERGERIFITPQELKKNKTIYNCISNSIYG